MVLQAVEARNAELAQRLMFEHFQEGEERLKQALKNNKDVQDSSVSTTPTDF